MRILRWILLLLYAALIFGLFSPALSGNGVPILGLVTVVSLALFLLGAGSKDLCRPIHRRRVILPVVVASGMLAILVAALSIAFDELFRTEDFPEDGLLFWTFLGVNWIGWGILLYVYTRGLERYRAIFRLAELVFAGSLAELLAALPAHVIVIRRGGCLVGIQTAIGLIAGICVMIWSFGPAIFLLFVREAYRRQKVAAPPSVAARGSRRGRFQFELRTLLLVMAGLSVTCSVVSSVWGYWPMGALAATVLLLLLLFPLSRYPKVLIPVGLLLTGILVWLSRDEEWFVFVMMCLVAVISWILLFGLFATRRSDDSDGVV